MSRYTASAFAFSKAGTHREIVAELLRPMMDQVATTPLLTPEEETMLFRRIERGGQQAAAAREHLILANTRLVFRIAMSSFRQGTTSSFTVEDAFMAGVVGLMQAIDRFDVSRGFRLSTYATWWIKQAITRAVQSEVATIRLPPHRWDEGQRPQVMLSINADAGEFDDGEMQSVLTERHSLCAPEVPFEELVEVHDYVERLLPEIPEREANILRRTFGLGGVPAATLKEVGEELGVTRERVRQLQERAFERLRVLLDEYDPGDQPKGDT